MEVDLEEVLLIGPRDRFGPALERELFEQVTQEALGDLRLEVKSVGEFFLHTPSRLASPGVCSQSPGVALRCVRVTEAGGVEETEGGARPSAWSRRVWKGCRAGAM